MEHFLRKITLFLCLLVASTAQAQLPFDEAGTTLRPALQQLGRRLLKHKTGSIVAIQPATGRVLCLVTNSAAGENLSLALATPYPPGSTMKTAEALALYSEGIIDDETTIPCQGAFRSGSIRVKCHKHSSPLRLTNALAYSCNTWFLSTFLRMMGDRDRYENKDTAITVWNRYMRSMGLGGPTGIDIAGEKGGLLANTSYLNRRYKGRWNAQTIMWIAMGQGDVTATPLQLCVLASSIANRGWWYRPHLHGDTPDHPLPQRYTTPRFTEATPAAYAAVIRGMRQAVLHGTLTGINTKAYSLCGKTGTAENAGRDHSAFIGFAPMDEPSIAVAVYIEHGGFGADRAAPIASLIIERYLKGRLSAASQQKANLLAAKP